MTREAELEAKLRSLQWSGTDWVNSCSVCPDCGEEPGRGHSANCGLARLIGVPAGQPFVWVSVNKYEPAKGPSP